jgi:3-deoxy-manno-octulosonate cytidylyltransferase (CMP-KDO synthetase)
MMSGLPDPGQVSLANIRLVITDIDGVMTDGGLYYNENGNSWERLHVRDKTGVRMLKKSGIRVTAVSGRRSEVLRKLLEEWGIDVYRLGVEDKVAASREILKELSIAANETAYIGDDSNDIRVFSECAISFAVADAPDYVKQAATYTLTHKGGEGALREASDRILSGAGKTTMLCAPYRPNSSKSGKPNKLRYLQERNQKSDTHVPR